MVANAIVPTTPRFMSPSIWQMMTQQASVLVNSGFLPASIKNANQALTIMMVGAELGIQPWQALSTINVIQGKPTISPQLMLALIQRSGQLEDIKIEGTDEQCAVTMKRKSQTAHTEAFSMTDAARLQLAGKDNWKKQPTTMLKWRAVAACARVVFPDVILGLYTPEEMGAEVSVTDDGSQVVVEVPVPQLTVVKPEAEITQAEIVQLPPDPERTAVGQKTDTTKSEKPQKNQSLFQWLMTNVKHPRYQVSEARARSIKKLQAEDLLYDAIPHDTALKLVNYYATLRDDGRTENEAMAEIRKSANGKAEERA